MWAALHDALWGWARVAVAGLAGAHERPLALLLVHLATLERAASARERAVARPCVDCDAHARTLFGGRPLSGCSAAALLVRLPIGSAAERAWALRLGDLVAILATVAAVLLARCVQTSSSDVCLARAHNAVAPWAATLGKALAIAAAFHFGLAVVSRRLGIS